MWERLEKIGLILGIPASIVTLLSLVSTDIRAWLISRLGELIKALITPIEVPASIIIVAILLFLFLIGLRFHPLSEWIILSQRKSKTNVLKIWRIAHELSRSPDELPADAGERLRNGAWKIGIREAQSKGTYGPYMPLESGKYRVSFRMKVDDRTDTSIQLGTLDVSTHMPTNFLEKRSVSTTDFYRSNKYQNFDLDFDLDEETANMEFRFRTVGNYVGDRYVVIDRVTLMRRSL
jgi:hypothetical protein